MTRALFQVMLNFNNQSYIPISMFSLIPGSEPEVNIYACAKNDVQPILLISKTEAIDMDRINRFEAEGVYNLFVTTETYDQFQAHLRSNWERLLEDDSLPLKMRLANIMEISRDLMAKAFANKRQETLVRSAQTVGRVLASLINRNQPPLRDLLDVMHRDENLATHSVNAAVFAILLADSLSYPLSDLSRIGTGVLLHDVGMLELDANLVKRPRKLDEFERKEIVKHPTLGFKMLCTASELSRDELMIVYQHHERVDGKGYPVALMQSEIHPWTRLCSVADTFEALTSDRPQRKRLSVASGISILRKEAEQSLDATFVRAWIQMLEAENIT